MKKYLFILISLILSSFPAYATLYAAPELKNADDMLNILPEQSLKITKQFLNKRKLLDSDSKNLIISRDGAENTTRTPASSVHAMQIMAKAYDALNLPTIALATIKEAQQIASVNQLIYLDIQSQIIQTQIRWHHQENPNQLIQNLNQIEDQLEAAQPKNSALNELTMQTYLLKANIFSSEQNPKQAQANFQHAEKILDSIDDPIQKINFHLEYGGFYLNTDDFDNALTQLLISYWMAIESSESSLLAQTNYQLSKLFFARQVYDKSLEHSSEAADFYKKYPDSKHLSQAISMMADSYFNQGQFNLALVHYLNILGNDQIRTHNENIDLWLNITKSYLSLSDK
ncbi:MAG: tetratricopeptide repeat protein, partial [Vibrio sp.]